MDNVENSYNTSMELPRVHMRTNILITQTQAKRGKRFKNHSENTNSAEVRNKHPLAVVPAGCQLWSLPWLSAVVPAVAVSCGPCRLSGNCATFRFAL